jgi:hypothetical protein
MPSGYTSDVGGGDVGAENTDKLLLDVMRHLNLAVAVVAQARDHHQVSGGDVTIRQRMIRDALVHIHGAMEGLVRSQNALTEKRKR